MGMLRASSMEGILWGFGGRGGVGVGRLAGVREDEIEVGFAGGAAALRRRRVRAVLGSMVWQ
jgi:hypothetical protein